MALLDHLFPGRGTKWPCNDLIFPGSKNEMPPLANELHFLAGQHITGLYLSQGQHTTELHRSAVLGRQDGQLRPTRDMNMPHGTVLEEPVVPVKPLGVRAGINKPVTSVVCLDLVGVVAETIAHPHAAEQEGLLGLGLLVVLVDLRGLRARRSVVVAVLAPDVALDCADITSAERALGNSVVSTNYFPRPRTKQAGWGIFFSEAKNETPTWNHFFPEPRTKHRPGTIFFRSQERNTDLEPFFSGFSELEMLFLFRFASPAL